jgi:phosphoribosylformylglycinamidine synthase
LIACNYDQAEALMIAASQAGVTLATVGKVGGDHVTFGNQSAPLADLSHIFRTAFADAVA